MKRTSLSLCIVFAFWCAVPLACAQWKEGEEPPKFDSSRPAIGTWIGQVSWNDLPITYAWDIYPDGGFSSGRFGRSSGGGGHWSSNDVQLSLKYDDGFRYDGEIHGDAYTGTASLPNGRRFGTFWMSRARPMSTSPEEAP